MLNSEILYDHERSVLPTYRTGHLEPLVGVIVLHYGESANSQEKINTKECLARLNRLSYGNTQLVVVDSGSSDNFDREFLLHYGPDSLARTTTYIKTSGNLGYAQATNLGAQFALNRNARYIFLINNDTFVSQECLTKLVDFAEDHPQVGSVGPKVYEDQEGEKSLKFQTIGGRFIGGNYGGGEVDRGQYEQPREVDFVTGAACLIRSEIIQQIGLFDPRFFIWVEDLELGIRLRKLGYQAFYFPTEVWHKRARSLPGRYGYKYACYSTRNLIFTIKRHPDYFGSQVLVRLALNMLKTSVGSIKYSRTLEAFSGLMKGVDDGLRG